MSLRKPYTVHNFVANNHKLWTFLFSNLYYNSFENVLGYEARAAFAIITAFIVCIRLLPNFG